MRTRPLEDVAHAFTPTSLPAQGDEDIEWLLQLPQSD